MNWAGGIVLSYVVFAAGTIGFAIFAINRPVDLVSPDYYARSLRQDRQMEAARNADRLGGAASIAAIDEGAIAVALPPSQARDAAGSITLYRASDASADRVFPLGVDAAGRQRVTLAGLRTGRWTAQLRWTAGGREFYLERPVVVR